jgi:hypothetical protein
MGFDVKNIALKKVKEYHLPYNYYERKFDDSDVENFIYYSFFDKYINPDKGFHPARLLALMLRWLANNETDKIKKYEKLLFENSLITDNELLFLYKFYFPLHQNYKDAMKPDWVSGFCQGLGLLFFARFYKKDNEELLVKIRNGMINERIVEHFFDGSILFHEYEHKCDALNGHIYALYGLYEHWYWTDDETSADLFKRGTKYVIDNIDKYRNPNGASFYCSTHKMETEKVGGKYHATHINQLVYLYKVTGCQKIKDIAKMFYDDYQPERNKESLKNLFYS